MKLVVHSLLFVLLLTGTVWSAERPNILLIVADDLGWHDVGWHGGQFETPHMDRLVREGLELDHHYVQPVCTPTRTALMSGRYPSRFGPHATAPSNLRAMPLGTETLASALQGLGYHTYQAGKWHLGSRYEWGPKHYGFDHSYGSLAGAVDPWSHLYRYGPFLDTWHRDCEPLHEEGNATELMAAQVVKWIEEKQGPWFIYMPFHAVHNPVDAPDEFKQRYANTKFHDDPVMNDSKLRLASMVTQLDAKVGQFVAALDKTGQRNNTLVIFTSDNGGLNAVGNPYVGKVANSPYNSDNTPLRGQKNQLYEGGIRVCAFANWPGKLKPRKEPAVMHVSDWFPTIAELVGYQPKQSLNWDGKNMWPVLMGQVTNPPSRTIYWKYPGGRAVRDGDWKLIMHAKKGVPGATELFNLADDPYEKRELASAEPERVEKLKAIIAQQATKDLNELPADLKGIHDF